ncbi:MAG: hypothetical protein ACOC9N_03150 [Gemmatimonadota bacterium]
MVTTRWLTLFLVLLTGCTYGPEQERVWIVDVERRPESRTFVAAVKYQRFRPPTGLSAFPNGGRERVLEQAAVLYRVDVATDDVHRVARIEAPEELRSTFAVHILGWRGERWYFTLSGCPGRQCNPELRRFRHFLVAPDGTIRPLGARPDDLDGSPGMVARAPGEDVYMRISSNFGSVRVRSKEGGPYVVRYTLDDSGELVAAARGGEQDPSSAPGS